MSDWTPNENLERDLDRLLASYREACGEPEPSPDFFPGLWSRIEARRRNNSLFFRWTRLFVAAAAAACLLIGALLLNPTQIGSGYYASTYVEALAAEAPADQILQDVARSEVERPDAFPFAEERLPR